MYYSLASGYLVTLASVFLVPSLTYAQCVDTCDSEVPTLIASIKSEEDLVRLRAFRSLTHGEWNEVEAEAIADVLIHKVLFRIDRMDAIHAILELAPKHPAQFSQAVDIVAKELAYKNLVSTDTSTVDACLILQQLMDYSGSIQGFKSSLEEIALDDSAFPYTSVWATSVLCKHYPDEIRWSKRLMDWLDSDQKIVTTVAIGEVGEQFSAALPRLRQQLLEDHDEI